MQKRNRLSIVWLSLIGIYSAVPAQAASSSVYMEELTWMEVKNRIQSGATTALVPTGGIEQNGPHMVVGKHNIVVRYTAGEIARQLGNALVAPVMAYVPEGRIEPAEGHMRFAGTLSVSDTTFANLLEDTARSLRQHGFRLICFIGDHAGSLPMQRQVADRLTQQWASEGVRVLNVNAYDNKTAAQNWINSMNIKQPNPTAHAGFVETSEVMAIDARGVRDTMRAARSERDYAATGAMGDSSQASADYGKRFLSLKIEAAVNQIQHAEYPSQ